jgi:hypothetical protein
VIRILLTTIIKTTTGCCSSGRHGKKGRQSDRHHVWWHGSPYTNLQNNYSPRTMYCVNQYTPRQKAYLLQYFDPLIIPPSITIVEDDVFYDSIYNQSYSPLQWKPPDTVPSLAITKENFNAFVDTFDVLSHYRIVKSLDEQGNLLLNNSTYRSLDLASLRYKRIMIQARYLKSQVFHYDKTLSNCDDDTPAIYVSCCENEPPVVIDTGASCSITPLGSDFVNGIVNKADLKELKQVNGSTDICGQGLVNWEIEDVNGIQR